LTTDYIGRKSVDFKVNNAGRTYLACLLDQLGADLSEMSSLNDGDYIKASTCTDWSSRLRAGIEDLREARIPDKHYVGNNFTLPLAKDIDPALELKSGSIGQYLTLIGLINRGVGLNENKIDPRSITIEPATAATKEWILTFAKFLQQCGGCWQW